MNTFCNHSRLRTVTFCENSTQFIQFVADAKCNVSRNFDFVKMPNLSKRTNLTTLAGKKILGTWDTIGGCRSPPLCRRLSEGVRLCLTNPQGASPLTHLGLCPNPLHRECQEEQCSSCGAECFWVMKKSRVAPYPQPSLR